STPVPEASRLKWFYTTEFGPAALAVANDTVYLTVIDGVYALTAVTGDLKWFRSNIGGADKSIPQIAGDVMYYCSSAEDLLAVNTANGAVAWKASIGFDSGSTPLVDAGTVYVNSADGFFYAFNSADGSLRWKTQIGGNAVLDLSSPAGSANFIYTGSDNG